MAVFPMPELERSVAMPTSNDTPELIGLERSVTFRPQRKANLSELEQLVKEFRREKDYSSALHVMNTVDGLKPTRQCVDKIEETRIEMEEAAMEKHENLRKIPQGIPEPTFHPIEPAKNIEHELDYIRNYGIEWFLLNYKNRYHEGITCLRDLRYINAQLVHLKDYE